MRSAMSNAMVVSQRSVCVQLAEDGADQGGDGLRQVDGVLVDRIVALDCQGAGDAAVGGQRHGHDVRPAALGRQPGMGGAARQGFVVRQGEDQRGALIDGFLHGSSQGDGLLRTLAATDGVGQAGDTDGAVFQPAEGDLEAFSRTAILVAVARAAASKLSAASVVAATSSAA